MLQKYEFLCGCLTFAQTNLIMRKISSVLLGLIMLIFLGSCHSGGQKDQGSENDSTLVQMHSHISDTLAAKMNTFLNTYYQLKDAFVKTDSAAVNEAAIRLQENAKVLSLDELQADAAKYNQAHAAVESLQGEITGLLGEKTMLDKRSEFQMISDITYDLVKTVGLKGQTVYRDFCPMFNDGKGAYWLSSARIINNPYYGQEMLGCGEVSETLQF
jgi:Cu(I)/Ag(I) efflux system membrane fusion protein